MPPILNRAVTPEGSVFTASTDSGTAVTVLDNIPPGVLSADVEKSYKTLVGAMDQFQLKTSAIVATAHPSLVDEQITAAIKSMLAARINRLVSAGQSQARSNNEAFDRASTPITPINEALRATYQTSLLQTDATAIMQALNKPDASLELIMAALDTVDLTALPDQYVLSLRERLVLRNSAALHVANAAAEPSVNEPFAVGVDPEKTEALAQGMMSNYRAKVGALSGVEEATKRLLSMLALLSGAAGPEVIWTAIRPS